MKKQYTLITISSILALTVLMIACSPTVTNTVKTYPDDMIIKFQTFGGFRVMDNVATDIIITSKDTTYITYSYDGNITTKYVLDTNKTLYDALVQSIIDNDYQNFKNVYTLDKDNLVTDVGNANLTITTSDKSKNIYFDTYLEDTYPSDIKGVLQKIHAFEDSIYSYQELQYINISYQPMQCDIAPWQTWLDNSGIRFIRAPTEPEIIAMYYGRNDSNLSLRKIVQINDTGITCEACGVCPKGYTILAEIQYKDFPMIVDDGWNRIPTQNHAP